LNEFIYRVLLNVKRWATDCGCTLCGPVWQLVEGDYDIRAPKSCPYDDQDVEPVREYLIDRQVALGRNI
jgi:hypothetical protein